LALATSSVLSVLFAFPKQAQVSKMTASKIEEQKGAQPDAAEVADPISENVKKEPAKQVTVKAETVQQTGAANVKKEGAEEEVPLTPCPYDDTSDVSEGIPCYFKDTIDGSTVCKCSTSSSWKKLLAHAVGHHKIKASRLAGTFLHTKANAERTTYQAEKRKADAAAGLTAAKKKAIKTAAKSGLDVGGGGGGGGDKVPDTIDVTMPAAAPAVASGSGGAKLNEDGTVWLGMRCWVKCQPSGLPVAQWLPVSPLECAGPCSTTPLPGSTSLDSVQTILPAIWTAKKEIAMVHGSQLAVATQLAVPKQDSGVPHPLQMMAEMYQGFKSKEQKDLEAETWKQRVPKVEIKQPYKDQEAPKAKREGVGRAWWPACFKADKVELPEFSKFLSALNKKEGRVDYHARGAGRALGSLMVTKSEAGTECTIGDVQVLVGFYLGDQYNTLTELPLLHPKFAWTEDLLQGLVNYCSFHIAKPTTLKIK
jgi:hypothetical protein